MKAEQVIAMTNSQIKSFQFSNRNNKAELISYWNEKKEIAQRDLSNAGIPTSTGKYNSPSFSTRESCKTCGEYGV